MSKDDSIFPQEIRHVSHVRWGKAFGGHGTELTMVQYPAWGEVHLKGGGYQDEWEHICHHMPIEVMRKIVAMYDALPPIPKGSVKE